MLEVEDAAARILTALHRRRAFVAFPPGNVWQVRCCAICPARPPTGWPTASGGSRCRSESSAMESLFRYVAAPSPCGYLPDQQWSLEYEYVGAMTPGEYLQRLTEGWRRFGCMMFRPACQACSACQSLRVSVEHFRPDRSQKRWRRANEGVVERRVGKPSVNRTKLTLYDRYHSFQADHKGWPQHPAKDAASYADSFVRHPFPVEEWCYYLDGRLVGVGYVDVLAGAAARWRRPGRRRRPACRPFTSFTIHWSASGRWALTTCCA